ncbi:MAG: hypothetical protein H7287_02210 [Thermoleophilia bacterium]|nr:hypothetical protein [Thermoleophilia bacterium]
MTDIPGFRALTWMALLVAACVLLVLPRAASAAAGVASPASASTVAGVVGVVARTGGGDDIVQVDLTVDGVNTGSSFNAPWGVLWDTRSVPDGAHDLRLASTSSTGVVSTSAPVRVKVSNGAGGGLAATYFRRADLTDAAVTRTDAAVNFDWGRQPPVPELPADGFSVRWAGSLEAPTTDVYTFTVQASDGVRLWLDQRLLVDEWGRRGDGTHTATVSLGAGKHYALRLEYANASGDAGVHLRWKSFHSGLTTIPARLLRPSPSASARTYGLRATFFSSGTMRSKAQLNTRVDPVLQFNWGSGSPDASVPHDSFYARWSGTLIAPKTGTYKFFTRADDGVRLFVGGRRVTNDWSIHPVRTSTGSIKLRKGKRYPIRLDYYEAGGQSEVSLRWQPPKGKQQALPPRALVPDAAPPVPPRPTSGLVGTYFDDIAMRAPILTRLDNTVEFDWNAGSPDPTMMPSDYSVRWTGALLPQATGTYELATEADDGVRVFVDGELVINDWRTHGPQWQRASLQLIAGRPAAIEVQYFQGGGGAKMQLAWTPPGGRRAAIPTANLQPREPVGPPLRQQPPAPPEQPQPGLWGVYYDEEDFTGAMAGRVDPLLAFSWRGGRPHPAVGQDTFSAAWTGSLAVPLAGDYTFTAQADDGVRVWIDGRLVIDRWIWRNPPIDRSAPQHLEPGRRYDIRVEQHDGGGDAGIELRWSSADMPEQVVPTWALMTPGPADPRVTVPVPPEFGAPPASATQGLWGLYWDDIGFRPPALAKVDATVDFDWGSGAPVSVMGSDTFTTRWLGTVEAPSAGDWTFRVRADDGVRLWVCGQLLVDQWKDQGATEYAASAPVHLEPGTPCAIKLEYYENGGGASVRLLWGSATTPKQVVPATALHPPTAESLAPFWWW